MAECRNQLIASGETVIPRKCPKCGFGPCFRRYQVSQDFEEWRKQYELDPLFFLGAIAEEAGEFLQVFGKLIRFGPSSYYPGDPLKTTNLALIDEELADLERSIADYKRHIRNMK